MRPETRKPLVLTASAVVVAAMLLVVLMNVDRSPVAPPSAPVDIEPIDLPPVAMPTRETPSVPTAPPPSRGFIQIAGPDGRLAQQYRCEHLDPAPEGRGEGWMSMGKPELEVYSSDGGVISLVGDDALVYAPNGSVESGSIEGSVIIRMFPDASDRTNTELELRTARAEFNSVLGEIVCDDEIHVQTTDGEFFGHDLLLLYDDQSNVIRSLRIDEVDHIRLVTAPRDASAADERTPSGDRFVGTGDALHLLFTFESDGLGTSGSEEDAEATPADTPFYRLTLADDVRIERGATADRGDAVLTVVPPPHPSDAIVTCAHGLIMVPADERLATARDARLQLVGSPVELIDPGRITTEGTTAGTTATGARLEYHMPIGRVDLVGSDTQPLRIESDQAIATGSRFSVTRSAGVGRLDGPGVIRFLETVDGTDHSLVPRRDRLRIAWNDHVDLRFRDDAETASPDGAGAVGADLGNDLGALEEATFFGAVDLHSENGVRVAGRESEHLDLLGGGPRHAHAVDDPEPGRLRAEEIAVTFTDAGTGLTPRRLVAQRNVVATGAARTLWANRLDATIGSTDGLEDGDETSVERVIASGDVQLRLDRGERVFADRVVIEPPLRTATLVSERRPVLLVDGPNVVDAEETVVVDDRSGTYRIDGRGRFWRFRGPIVEASHERLAALTPDDLAAIPNEQLRVRWSKGVTIEAIAPITDEAIADVTDVDRANVPRRAMFEGDVRVRTPELLVSGADELIVGLAGGPAATDDQTSSGDRTAIESIDASGALVLESVGQPGTIRCRTLHVDLDADDAGRTVPKSMYAEGLVHVEDGVRHLWAQRLDAAFRAADPASPEAVVAAPGSGEPADPLATARAELDTVIATGDVQMRLEDGERIFADRVTGHAGERRAQLDGTSILIVGRDFMLVGPHTLDLGEGAGTHHLDGAGRFAATSIPIEVPADLTPLDRASLEATIETIPTTIDANWSDSADFRDGSRLALIDAAGSRASPEDTARYRALELRGAVHVESDPEPNEWNSVDAGTLAIDFLGAAEAKTNGDAETDLPTTPPGTRRTDAVSKLVAMRASDEARIESRTWTNPERTGTPRLFYIAGDDIVYDQVAMEAHVTGRGELLVRQEPEVAGESDDGLTGPLDRAFGRGGTSLFRWTDRLDMTRVVDERFDIAMAGAVQCLQRDATGQRSQLDAGEVIASVDRGSRPDPNRPDGVPAPVDAAQPGVDAFDLGGAVELRRLVGRGSVHVETPQRSVACDSFDYNLMTDVAELAADPGRRISILNRGAVQPARAGRVLWNMGDDTITIMRGGG